MISRTKPVLLKATNWWFGILCSTKQVQRNGASTSSALHRLPPNSHLSLSCALCQPGLSPTPFLYVVLFSSSKNSFYRSFISFSVLKINSHTRAHSYTTRARMHDENIHDCHKWNETFQLEWHMKYIFRKTSRNELGNEFLHLYIYSFGKKMLSYNLFYIYNDNIQIFWTKRPHFFKSFLLNSIKIFCKNLIQLSKISCAEPSSTTQHNIKLC